MENQRGMSPMKNHYQVNLPQVRQYTVKGIYNLEQNFCYLGSKILVDELLNFMYTDPFMINSFLLTTKTSHKLQSTPWRFYAVVNFTGMTTLWLQLSWSQGWLQTNKKHAVVLTDLLEWKVLNLSACSMVYCLSPHENEFITSLYLYIWRGFRNLDLAFFIYKNIPNLINLSLFLKNRK